MISGVAHCQAAGTRGKLWVAFHVKLPDQVQASKELLEQLAIQNNCAQNKFLLAVHERYIWCFQKYQDHGSQKKLVLPDGYEYDTYTFHRQNSGNSKLVMMISDTVNSSTMLHGNMMTKWTAPEEPSFEDIMDFLGGTTEKEWTSIHANAKLAVMRKTATAMQIAVDKVSSMCSEFIAAQTQSSQSIIRAVSVPVKLTDFANLDSLKVTVLDLQSRQCISLPFRQYTHGKLHMQKMLWVVGRAGGGKSTLAMALGEHFARMMGLGVFMFTSSYDAVGLATRSKTINECACIIWDDAKPVSQANEVPLQPLDLISIMNVATPGTYPCRYHVAMLAPKVARIATINGGPMDDNTLDYGHFFALHGMGGVAALARGDNAYLMTAKDTDIALARRNAILVVPDLDTLGVPLHLLEEDLDAELEARLARPGLSLNSSSPHSNCPAGSSEAATCGWSVPDHVTAWSSA